MNVNGYLNWRKIVDEHYGSLDKFADAQTIRHMRNDLALSLTEQARVVATIRDEEFLEEFNTLFESEVQIARDAIAEFDNWLAKRNLTL